MSEKGREAGETLVAIVSPMALHYALTHGRGSDWVASMVNQALQAKPIPGQELDMALSMLEREKR